MGSAAGRARGRGRFLSRLRGGAGNVLVLFALLLPVLMGLGALALDVGYLYYVRTAMQAAADAAAMAGATGLVVSSDEATARANAIGNQNIAQTPSLAGSALTVTFPSSTTIAATVSNPAVPLFFGRAIGWSSAAVAASASAGLAAASSVTGSGIVPLSVYCPVTPCAPLTPGTAVTGVRVGCGMGNNNPCAGENFAQRENTFQAVYFDTSWSAAQVGDYISGSSTFTGTVSAGDILTVAYGNENGILWPAIHGRVGDTVVVPVVERYSTSGSTLTGVRVTGFYALEITRAIFRASEIEVSFVVRQHVVSATSFSSSSATTASAVGVRLGS